jgi:hypothetical protein
MSKIQNPIAKIMIAQGQAMSKSLRKNPKLAKKLMVRIATIVEMATATMKNGSLPIPVQPSL